MVTASFYEVFSGGGICPERRMDMADVRPFRGVRPRAEKASRIAALPYDVMNTEEAREEVRREPLSFLRIDRAEVNFPEGEDPYSDPVYEKAASIFREMQEDGSFLMEEKPCYYLYELTMNGRSQTGIAAVCAADDYVNHTIKKHENTRAEKEADRIRHVGALGAQTGPIFLAYRADRTIGEITDRIKKEEAPVYDFESPDGIRHRVWIVSGTDEIERLRSAFAAIESIYIADGHHRCASAVKVCLKKREEAGEGYDKEAEYNYFLSVLFPDEELMIMDYNRVVKDLCGLSEDRFFDRLRKKFLVEEAGSELCRPSEKGTFGMYISGAWYRLIAKESARSSDPVTGLDVSILQNEILSPILGIEDPKTDPRIDFVGGIRGLKEIEKRVDSGEMTVAFAMYPTSIRELFAVADAGELMPPKSTWFEPKLRSGLLIHKFE